MSVPAISVVILNYNGRRWLDRCLESLKAQTFFDRIEVIIADNASQDGSDKLSEASLQSWPNGRFVQNGGNFGYCEGNNLGARHATGKYLFFLNNDTWMAPDCLEKLFERMEGLKAGAGSPQILNYVDQQLQGYGRSGFDLFGFYNNQPDDGVPSELFIAPGCAYCIRADLFWKLGGFDREFFMYVDETDLSWRVWISGERVITVPEAKLYHWGAGASAPAAGAAPTPAPALRISAFGRFHTQRNSLLTLLKSTEHFLLLMVPLHALMILAEAVFVLGLTRDLGLVTKGYLAVFPGVWKLRHHVLSERKRLAALRQRSDFWMLRFLHLVPEQLRVAIELLSRWATRST